MEVATLIEFLRGLAPELTTQNFVNIPAKLDGVIASRLGVCVDPTEDTITRAVNQGVSILISYHPWHGEAEQLIRDQRLGIIPLHTAWDNAPEGTNMMFAKEIGLTNIRMVENVVIGKCDLIFKNLLERCQRAVDQNIIPYYGEMKNHAQKVGIWTGPGFLPFHRQVWETCYSEGCDTIISGEAGLVPYRYAALHQMKLIDLGHSPMAKPGMAHLTKLLESKLGESGQRVELFPSCYGCNYYTNFNYSQPDESEDFISLFKHR